MSGKTRVTYKPALSQTTLLYRSKPDDLLRPWNSLGEALLDADEEFNDQKARGTIDSKAASPWAQLIEQEDKYFPFVGDRHRRLLDLNTDTHHSSLFAIWDFIHYLDAQARAQRKDQYLQKILCLVLTLESERALSFGASGANEYVRRSPCVAKTLMLYMIHTALAARASSSTGEASGVPSIMTDILDCFRQHQESAIALKKSTSAPSDAVTTSVRRTPDDLDSIATLTEDQRKVIRAIRNCFCTIVINPLKNNGLHVLPPFKARVYDHEVDIVFPETLSTHHQVDPKQAEFEKKFKAKRIVIPEHLNGGPCAEFLNILQIFVDRLLTEGRTYKAGQISRCVAHLLQVQQAAPGLSKDDLALQAFHTLRVAIQDPKSALGKAVRIRGGRIGNLLIPEFLRSKKIRTVTHLCSQLLRIQFELEGANADPILALSRTASTRQSTRKIGEEERMSVFALPRASQTLEEKNGRGGDSRVATLSRGRRDSATQRYEEGGLAITDTTF